MRKKKICLDISNIVPGKSGSGGGIATYANNLIKELYHSENISGIELICFKHPDFLYLEDFSNMTMINKRTMSNNPLGRIYWLHFYLPFFCIFNRIDLLHRVTPELPIVKVCKYVCTLHDLMFDFYISNQKIRKYLGLKELIKFHIFNLITKHANNKSDSIIVPSAAIKNELIEKYKINFNKVSVLHEAAEKRRTCEILGKTHIDKKLHIGVIAGFYPHKGHMKVLELAEKFIDDGFSNFQISFRGNPEFPNYIAHIKTKIRQKGLEDHIGFVKFTPEFILEEIYAKFDIILLLSEYEGFGLPVLEAQSYNLPVFCSDIPVFKEILGESGYYVDYNPTRNAIKQIISALKDQNFLQYLSELGRNNLNKYSWEKMSNETIELYRTLLAI